MKKLKLLLTIITLAIVMIAATANSAIFYVTDQVNKLVGQGWQVVSVSDPFAYGTGSAVLIWFFNPGTGQIVVWTVLLTK